VLLFLTVDEMGLLFFPMCGGIKLPSLVFVGTGTDAGFSDGFLGTYKIGLFFPSSPGWSVGWRAGVSVVETSGSLLSDVEMAASHLVSPVRSAGKKHVGVAGMLLLVPFKTFENPLSEGWSASTRLFRPPAMRMTGRSL
jgi:hypothetical protein